MIPIPLFTIVMPALDRRVEVRRAIDNCLTQDFTAFEIVVVDGGSKDGTAEAVAAYSDPRVRLIVDLPNRGVCPARNAAVKAARGEWIVFLDSDHEMLPGCLSRIQERAAAAGQEVDRLGFRYLFDDGRVTPSPFPPEVLGYTEWLRWIDRARWTHTDALWATRRRSFACCELPESFATEFSYFLDFAKHFKTLMFPLTLALQHTDSPNRLSNGVSARDPEMARRKSAEQAANWRYVLAEHGDALRRLAPRRYRDVLRGAALSNLEAGNRKFALKNSLAGLWRRPASPYAWAAFLLVLAGPRMALLVNRWRARRRRKCVPASAASPAPLSGPAVQP